MHDARGNITSFYGASKWLVLKASSCSHCNILHITSLANNLPCRVARHAIAKVNGWMIIIVMMLAIMKHVNTTTATVRRESDVLVMRLAVAVQLNIRF